jgi:hypothetical protein
VILVWIRVPYQSGQEKIYLNQKENLGNILPGAHVDTGLDVTISIAYAERFCSYICFPIMLGTVIFPSEVSPIVVRRQLKL